MLELTRKADYAIRLMVEVASEDAPLSTLEIAEREEIPYQFLRKIARQLVAAGLLKATRGSHGGLTLAHSPETVALLEIVRAVEDPALSRCLVDPSACNRRSRCVVFPVWRQLQLSIEDAMAKIPLAHLAEEHRRVAGRRGPRSHLPQPEVTKRESISPIRTGRIGTSPGAQQEIDSETDSS